MKIHEMEQRSPEWFAVRLGKITATSFDTMANGKPATIKELCRATAAERFFGCSAERPYVNAAMETGIAREAEARATYEMAAFEHVREVGFVELDEYIGCSPDGLVGEDGGCEIKCPELKAHSRYYAGDIDSKYRWQVQGALWVTGRKWWDFVSYLPEAAEPAKRLVVMRVLPDAEAFAKLEAGAAHCRERIAAIVKGFGNGNIQG